MAKLSPALNAWYQDAQEDVLFEIVAIDEQEGSIEVQFYDGDVGEIDFETWQQMILLPAQPPEDWRSSYTLDDSEFNPEEAPTPCTWSDPLAEVEPDGSASYDDF